MWYYVLDGEKHGPVSEEEIHDLIHDGHLDSESYIWTAEMNDWKSISEVEQFLPKPPPIPSDAVDNVDQNKQSRKPATQDHQNALRSRFQGKPEEELGRDDIHASDGNEDDIIVPDENKTGDSFTTQEDDQKDDQYSYASFIDRLMAFLVDLLIFPLATFLVGGLVGGVLGVISNDPTVPYVAGQVLGYIAPFLYWIGFEGSEYDATPGKQFTGLRVTGLNHDGIGYAKATGRLLGRFLSTLPLMIGYLAPLFMEKKQTFHDYAAGCLVVKE